MLTNTSDLQESKDADTVVWSIRYDHVFEEKPELLGLVW